MSEKNKNIDSLAKSLELVEVDTRDSVNMLRDDILMSVLRGALTRNDNELVEKCERLYHDWYPRGILDKEDQTPVDATLLIGPPGHGKTTSFKVALKEVADGLGLTYLENAQINRQQQTEEGITRNHLCFVSQETAGIVSSLEWAGLPSEDKIKSNTHADGERAAMGRLFDARLLALEESAGGVLLLDDFLNASPQIQNVGLSISEEKRFGSLSLDNACVGLTGNMGSVDGTHTTRASTALRNRCKIFFIQDHWKNFLSRAHSDPRYRDEVGLAGVDGFLERRSQNFFSEPDPKMMGGYNTPRSWMKYLNEARRTINRYGGRANMSDALPALGRLARSLLGPQVGYDLTVYMRSLADLADPLARKVIREGTLDTEMLAKKFKDGYSADEHHFAYQYANALADYTAQKVIEDKGDLKVAVERFTVGMSPLNGSSFTHGMNVFKQRLANHVESLSEKVKDGERSLSFDACAKITAIVSESPLVNARQIQDMVDALSDWDKMKSLPSTPVRRQKK